MCSILPTWCFDSTLDRCVDAWKRAGHIGWRVACSRPRGTAVVGSPYSSRHSELATGPSIRLAGEELFKLRIPEILGKSFLAHAPSGGKRGWVRLPIRWTVERTFAWLTKCRRLSIDREKSTLSAKAMIYLAMIHMMLNRLSPQEHQQEFQYHNVA